MTKTAFLNAINEYVCYFVFTRMLCCNCNNNIAFSLFVLKKNEQRPLCEKLLLLKLFRGKFSPSCNGIPALHCKAEAQCRTDVRYPCARWLLFTSEENC